MNYVAEMVAQCDCIAHTSRFVFSKDPQTGEIQKAAYGHHVDTPMNEVLEGLIEVSDVAIVLYSVPAGHYNEAHWCAEKGKLTLGLAFTRGVRVNDSAEGYIENCEKLHVPVDEKHSECVAATPWTAWRCVDSGPCPFKKQSISLNQIEYFITNHDHMKLLAVERIPYVVELIRPFLYRAQATSPSHGDYPSEASEPQIS
jgi:hypothetical protein